MHTLKTPLWRELQRKSFFQWESLADYLCLTPEQRTRILQSPSFPLLLPLRLAEKIQKGTLEDPILKQFLPTIDENNQKVGFLSEPVADSHFRKDPKLLHKYESRVLIIATGACAMNCRFCFRQNFDYQQTDKSFEKEIDTIKQDLSIREVILSGGDPLSLSDFTLKNLLEQICSIPHVKRIRFHTRFPIGIPERIDDSFIEILRACTKQIWFVIHANHPAEFDEDIFAVLKQIQCLGIPILSQSVLLKDINDDLEVIVPLCELLTNHGIQPYYLHQLDKVIGSSHFEVSIEKGRWLIEEATKRLSGYAVPKFVQEIPGKTSKTPLL